MAEVFRTIPKQTRKKKCDGVGWGALSEAEHLGLKTMQWELS